MARGIDSPSGFYLFFSSVLTAHRIVQPNEVPAIVYPIVSLLMLRRLPAGLVATAAFIAPMAVTAQEGSAEDLDVMSISLKDVVKPTMVIKTNKVGQEKATYTKQLFQDLFLVSNDHHRSGFNPLSSASNPKAQSRLAIDTSLELTKWTPQPP